MEIKCPHCNNEIYDHIDTLDHEIDLEDNRYYVREWVQCENCKKDYKIISGGAIQEDFAKVEK